MSSHFGIVVLVIVGAATVLGVIIAAVFETRRMGRSPNRRDERQDKS